MATASRIGWVLVLLLGCAGAAAADPPKPEKSEVATFAGHALAVHLKRADQSFMCLVDPEVRMLGDRSFLTGSPLDDPIKASRVWIPLSDVTEIQEFNDAKELGKWYKVPPHAEK